MDRVACVSSLGLLLGALSVAASGCGSSNPTASAGDAAVAVVLPPDPPTTTSGSRTAEAASAGLCGAFDVSLVDTSPVQITLGSPGVVDRVFAHDLGFVVQWHSDGSGTEQLTTFRAAAGGTVRSGLLAPESGATLLDALATSDGGWLAAWADDSLAVYLTRYDANGAPIARTTANVPSGGQVFLGTNPAGDGTIDIAWSTSTGLLAGVLSPANLTAFPTGSPLRVPGTFAASGWAGGEIMGTRTIDHPMTSRSAAFSPDGALVVDLPLYGQTWSTAHDGQSLVFATDREVGFAAQAGVAQMFTDVLFPYVAVAAAPAGLAVAGLDDAAGGEGGVDALEIAEVTPGGARSPLASVSLPPNVLRRDNDIPLLRLTALPDGSAYLVVEGGSASVDAAVFTCTERGS